MIFFARGLVLFCVVIFQNVAVELITFTVKNF